MINEGTVDLLDEIFKEHFYCKVLWEAIKDIHDEIPNEALMSIWETSSEEVLQVMHEVLEEDDVWTTFVNNLALSGHQ